MRVQKNKSSSIYQIKVSLKYLRPAIWRRLLVEDRTPLSKLHRTIQAAMGWEDYHLHHFAVGGELFGVPDPEFDMEVRSERSARLRAVAPAVKSRFTYVYDFGDNWEHDILVEEILPLNPEARYPFCVTGKRACPPEDAGGVWGYARKLETLGNPADPGYEDIVEWMGEDFDPEAFNLLEVNRRLSAVR
jgi:hypothetical protein